MGLLAILTVIASAAFLEKECEDAGQSRHLRVSERPRNTSLVQRQPNLGTPNLGTVVPEPIIPEWFCDNRQGKETQDDGTPICCDERCTFCGGRYCADREKQKVGDRFPATTKVEQLSRSCCPSVIKWDKPRQFCHQAGQAACQLPTVCTHSEWTEWQSCTRSCGGGQKTRQRVVTTAFSPSDPTSIVDPANLTCAGHGDIHTRCDCPLEETVECNTCGCGYDCVLAPWGEWGECSQTCGEGSRTRTRTVEKRGKKESECNPQLYEVKTCFAEECPSWLVNGAYGNEYKTFQSADGFSYGYHSENAVNEWDKLCQDCTACGQTCPQPTFATPNPSCPYCASQQNRPDQCVYMTALDTQCCAEWTDDSKTSCGKPCEWKLEFLKGNFRIRKVRFYFGADTNWGPNGAEIKVGDHVCHKVRASGHEGGACEKVNGDPYFSDCGYNTWNTVDCQPGAVGDDISIRMSAYVNTSFALCEFNAFGGRVSPLTSAEANAQATAPF